MTKRITKTWTATMRVATATAWLFALGTLGSLVTFIALGWAGEGGTTFASTTVDDTKYNAFGLSYQGLAGTIWLWFQAVVVMGAIVLSTLPANRLRRLGHLVLIGWAGLWLANAIWLSMLDGGSFIWLWGTVFGAFFLATVVRGVRGWAGRSPRPSPGEVVDADVAPGEDHADAVQVAH